MSGQNPTLQATIDVFISDAALAHQFVNGGADEFVQTPNGQYPTLANIAAASQAAILQISNVSSMQFSVSGTTPDQIVDSLGITEIRAAKYDITVSTGTGYQFSTVSLIQDGTDVTIMEYGRTSTNGDQASFDAVIVDGFMQLLVTVSDPSTTVKAVRTIVPV